MMIYQVKEEEGGVHSVTRDMLITARRKAKYREKVIADVHKRLYNTYEDSGWWIFKRKKSQFDAAGLDSNYPFDAQMKSYDTDAISNTMRKNPRRRAWVAARIADCEKK